MYDYALAFIVYLAAVQESCAVKLHSLSTVRTPLPPACLLARTLAAVERRPRLQSRAV